MLFTIIVERKNISVVNLVPVDFSPAKIQYEDDEIFNHSFNGVVSATVRTLHNGKRTKCGYRN